MNDLTDLQICKRIAEIEGEEYFSDNLTSVNIMAHCPALTVDAIFMYNPLTDDALCFQLMVKYQIKVMYESNPNYYHASKVIHAKGKKPFRIGESDSSPNKAILLAIIEAHNDKPQT